LKKVVPFDNPPSFGHFVDQKLPFLVVNSIANRIWGSLRLLEVLSSDNGFFLKKKRKKKKKKKRKKIWGFSFTVGG
jgi:hypothetical protein